MTIIEVINAGIDNGGGDQSLAPHIKRCLNAWIKHQVALFPFMRSTERTPEIQSPLGDLPAGLVYIDLPTSYFALEAFVLIDPVNMTQQHPLRVLDDYDRDNLIESADTRGRPQYVHVDHKFSRIYLFPVPDTGYKYYMRYKKMPVELDAAANLEDSLECTEENIGYPDPLVLIKVCEYFTLQWRRKIEEARSCFEEIRIFASEANRGSLQKKRLFKRPLLSSQFFRKNPYRT